MHARFLLPVFALIGSITNAATFLGPTSDTNRLVVPTNSAIIITSLFGDYTNGVTFTVQGFTFTQPVAPLAAGSSYALAGPAELILSNVAAVTYYSLTNAGVRTFVAAIDPGPITIETNQTIRLFSPPAPVPARFASDGGNSVSFTLVPNQPAEFSGPGTLWLHSAVPFPDAEFVSYSVAEDGFVLPVQQAVASPSGAYGVMVEKSSDLKNWSPVLLENTADAGHAFYRLRIQH